MAPDLAAGASASGGAAAVGDSGGIDAAAGKQQPNQDGSSFLPLTSCVRGCCRSDRVRLDIPAQQVQIGEVIAAGAEGVVHRGMYDGETVAVKKPRLATREDIDRFHSELQLLSTLSHPSLAAFVGAVAHPPSYLLVFRMYAGGNVHHALHTHGWQPSARNVLRTALAVGQALAHMHAHGVVHRDVKPANILLDASGEEAVLSDLGLAERAEQLHARAQAGYWKPQGKPTGGFHKRHMVGTIQYMAPEVLLKKGHTFKSDVYSFGITLNELATRIFPYANCTTEAQPHTVLEMSYTEQQLIAAVTSSGLRPTPIAAPSAPGAAQADTTEVGDGKEEEKLQGNEEGWPPAVTAAVAGLVQQCWHDDPARRPDMQEVLSRLEAALQLQGAVASAAVADKQGFQEGGVGGSRSAGPAASACATGTCQRLPWVAGGESYAACAAPGAAAVGAAGSRGSAAAAGTGVAADTGAKQGLAKANESQSNVENDAVMNDVPQSSSSSSSAIISDMLNPPNAAARRGPFIVAHPNPAVTELLRRSTYEPAVTAGWFEDRGKREFMEDACVVARLELELELLDGATDEGVLRGGGEGGFGTPAGAGSAVVEGRRSAHLFAVFDGHRGAEAAQFAANNIAQVVTHNLSRMSPSDSLKHAFLQIDETFRWSRAAQLHQKQTNASISGIADGGVATAAAAAAAMAAAAPVRESHEARRERERHPGCTAIAALVVGDQLVVANAGDCRAVLATTASPSPPPALSSPPPPPPASASASAGVVVLTRDHVASDAEERARVVAAGGMVEWRVNTWRVGKAAIEITRSLGDADLKPAVTAEPEINVRSLGPGDEFLVMASDGLWEKASNQGVVAMVHDTVKEPTMAAKRLVMDAAERGSRDNITAVVAFLRPVSTAERVF